MKKIQKITTKIGITLLLASAFTSCNTDQEDLNVDSTTTIEAEASASRTATNRQPIVSDLRATLAVGQTETFDTLEGSFDPDGDTIFLDEGSVFGGRPNDVSILSNGRIRITRRSTRGATFFFTIKDSKGARTQGRINMFALRPGSF